MTLTNSKAEVLDQLEDARNSLRAQAGAQGEIQAMKEAVKEKEALVGNLRNQIRGLRAQHQKDIAKLKQVLSDPSKIEDCKAFRSVCDLYTGFNVEVFWQKNIYGEKLFNKK